VSDEEPPAPANPPTKQPNPKRGAFPTPKHEIEHATPFIPAAETPTEADTDTDIDD
jgi:hypothetical protein